MKEKKKNYKVAVFSHRHIGDTLFSQPIIKILENKNYNVTVFVRSKVAKEITTYFHSFKGSVVILEDRFFNNIKFIKQEKFDVSLLLNFSLEVALLSFLGRIKYRFGKAHEGRGILLTQSFNNKVDRHALDIYYDTLDVFFKNRQMKIDYKRDYPLFTNDNKKEKKILFQVGTTRESKKIPNDMYIYLIEEIKKITKDYQIILCGDDVENARLLEDHVDDNLVGKTSFREYVDLIGSSSVLFSPDTSAIHIGCAFGLKVYGFYGSTSVKHYGPLSDSSFVNALNYECMPCYKNNCLYSKNDPQFMKCFKHLNIDTYLNDFKEYVNSYS